MKKLSILITLLFSGIVFAQEPIAEANKGVEYGEGVPEHITFDVKSTNQVVKALEKTDKLEDIVIRAKAIDVCKKRGCWVTLENDYNEVIFVKMKDYGFFLPESIIGKTILLHADAEKKVTSVKELQHYAKDAGKSKKEIKAIVKPKTEIRVLAKGIKVID